jgi:uncharacterized protein YcfJ
MNITSKTLIGLGLAAAAQLSLAQVGDVAQVLRSDPIVERIQVVNRICDQVVQVPQERGVGGAILGGLGGALVGSRFGQGHGKDALTIAGAVGGAIAGDHIQNESGGSTTQTACRDVTSYQERVSGYRVTFRYAGRDYTQVMTRDPGADVPVNVNVVAQ